MAAADHVVDDHALEAVDRLLEAEPELGGGAPVPVDGPFTGVVAELPHSVMDPFPS
jgi:hypothetical protein